MSDDPTRTLDSPTRTAKQARLWLEVVEGTAHARIEIVAGHTLIGRAEGAQLRLEADGVSRHHAKVVDHGDGLVNVLDLGSTNGTYLNGRRVDAAVLREGDELRVGQVVLRVGGEVPSAPRPATGSGPPLHTLLTARELEVARCVAQGLTNAEIGKRLFISARTVSTHLANIYERLDIHTRAALASAVSAFDHAPDSR
jgi:DNA-binding CsgD family transcriptional regulator